jgi:alanine racemase
LTVHVATITIQTNMQFVHRATRAVIHLDNLARNIQLVRERVGEKRKICMSIKADAYGHGARILAVHAVKSGVDSFGVATIQEGMELRKAGITEPVLLHVPPVPEEVPALVRFNLIPFVGSLDIIVIINEEAKKRNTVQEVHLKVDTGMGRIGCRPEEALSLAQEIKACTNLKLGGVCTHFPGSDLSDNGFTQNQLSIFHNCLEKIKQVGIDPGVLHAANSGAIIGHADSYLDMVRPGIMLYGYYPSHDQKRDLPLKPVMEFMSKVIFIKRVEPETPLSYGMTYTTKKTTCIATIPAGYADGYNRLLSNRGEVLIRGRCYPIVGRICMDQCLVDIGPNPEVKLYDDVVLFGPDPHGPDAEEIADKINTIPYEVTCFVSRRVPRVYING